MSQEERSRWNAVHESRRRELRDGERPRPAAFLVAREHLLPRTGRALDVAGGSGRHALWLARRGLEVTLIDVSEVGVAVAEEALAEAGLDLATRVLDLDDESPPAGPWDLILCYHYVNRDLYRVLPGLLAPGGVVIIVQPTVRNLERHERPSRRYLLEAGELEGLVLGGHDLEAIELVEDWTEDGRHEAAIIARRRA